jgi:uncharacterized protein (DUF305 family)
MHPGSARIQRTAIVLVVTLGSACSGASVGRSSAPQPMTRAQSDMAAIAKARADSTRLPYTEADIHFMSGMIAHHSQAILMAKWAPTHGANPTLLALTERIINAQQDEITLMQRWLRDRNQPVPSGMPGPMKMPMDGMEHEMLMPGMLTDNQLKELDAARGTEFDRLFLTFMIQHHRGAVSMVKDLFATYGAGQDETVFKFASDVNVDQTTEIARMQKMLMAVVLGTPAP